MRGAFRWMVAIMDLMFNGESDDHLQWCQSSPLVTGYLSHIYPSSALPFFISPRAFHAHHMILTPHAHISLDSTRTIPSCLTPCVWSLSGLPHSFLAHACFGITLPLLYPSLFPPHTALFIHNVYTLHAHSKPSICFIPTNTPTHLQIHHLS